MELWAEPFVKLRVPHIMSLRRDPFERADFNSNTYWDWVVDHVPQPAMQAVIAGRLRTLKSSAASETGLVQPRLGDGTGENAARLALRWTTTMRWRPAPPSLLAWATFTRAIRIRRR